MDFKLPKIGSTHLKQSTEKKNIRRSNRRCSYDQPAASLLATPSFTPAERKIVVPLRRKVSNTQRLPPLQMPIVAAESAASRLQTAARMKKALSTSLAANVGKNIMNAEKSSSKFMNEEKSSSKFMNAEKISSKFMNAEKGSSKFMNAEKISSKFMNAEKNSSKFMNDEKNSSKFSAGMPLLYRSLISYS